MVVRRLGLWLALVVIATALSCATSARAPDEDGDDGSSGGAGGSGTAGDGGGGGMVGPCVFAEDCIAVADACNIGTCINGMCQKAPANDGVACDDGKQCSENDHCQAGACAGTKKFCPSTDVCHVGDCDLDSDSCVEVPGNDGVGCVDQDACTQTSFCSGGLCAPGQATDCSALNTACGTGVCDPGLGCMAMPKNDGDPCDDFQFCSVNDVCMGGTCMGSPNTCAAPGDVCKIGSCNEIQDLCVAVPGNDGSMCDDGNACTASTTCAAGTCSGGVPANEGGACDDKQACTSMDSCTSGVCTGTAVVACIDGDDCCPAGCDLANDDDCGGTVFMTSSNGDPGFYAYDVPSNTWSIKANPPVTTHSQITTDAVSVHLYGDNNQIYTYDAGSNSWSAIAVGPDPNLAGQPIGFFKWTPNGYYYLKDGNDQFYRSNGAIWDKIQVGAFLSCAGSYDPVSQRLYVREYGTLGLFVFDTVTNSQVSFFPSMFGCGENSRTGSFLGGYFYARDWSAPFTKIDVTNGAAMPTAIVPSEGHTATDVDVQKGDIYIGPYDPTGTTFQKYNPGTGMLTTLASAPVPLFNHSTIVFVQ